MKGSLLL